MSDFWHKLGCCVVEKPQPKKRRRRIDRSMIGEPMNFVHLTHIGSGDMAAGEGLPMIPGVFSPNLNCPPAPAGGEAALEPRGIYAAPASPSSR
ncbi:CDC42 small effector protein 1 isoform X1 [Myiozetetes cayanensis]|uniref:CDC42 small effector protein 1 isoform X1 n=1 Tax=Myiozetetes cayanensis TaxID=478635 RepID=UPI00215E055A|nr:CDC42 small effector protein 1 isoform X1 [Myiozetetes cayanensis]XP_050186455.1 CDC42 small effector protein 1 isoform X1 [Myiozetetes cayanensis]